MAAEARSFLRHQVRNLVGTLKLVGDGSWPIERVAVALAAGLCLMGVGYAEDPFGKGLGARRGGGCELLRMPNSPHFCAR